MPKILIIEDNPDISAIERDYLELSGYEVSIQSDGTAGLAAVLSEDYDLLLLDLMLPGTDGFTICRAVREKKDIPDIFMCCGTEDFLLENNREFHNFLENRNIPHEYFESKGNHDMTFWNEYAEKAVKWMFELYNKKASPESTL